MKYFSTLLVLVSLLLYPTHADAEAFNSFHKGQKEYSLQLRHGEKPSATKDHFTFTGLRGRYAIFTSDRSQTSFALAIDKLHSSTADFLFTGTIGYRKYFLTQGRVSLAYDLDCGLAYFSSKVASQGTKINFTEQIGLLAQYSIEDDAALALEYRFSHISNANIKRPNSGINSNTVSLIYSWYR